LFPPGGRAGSTVEVAIAGADLDDVTRLVFSHTNIVALTNSGEKFVVSIAPDVPPGVYDARVIGRYGISNPRVFAVGNQLEVVETGSTGMTNAMELAIGSVVSGRTDANAADYFEIRLARGERVFIECAARAIDSRCQPVVTLYDETGRELARNRSGSLLDFTATSDMAAVIKLHDFLFRGGPEYHYRLSISKGPHVDFALPIATVGGATNKLTMYGRNLGGGQTTREVFSDGQRVEQSLVEVAAPLRGRVGARSIEAVAVEGFYYRLAATNGLSNPVFVGLATAPVVMESEPNSKPTDSQKLAPPCEVSGQFYPGGDQDWFTFDAKKGEAYWMEVFSKRLGCPTDPFLLVQRVSANGAAADVKELYDSEAVNVGDLKADSRDPAWRLEVSEDATYRLQVRDLFNRVQSDPQHIYQLSIRRDSGGFDLLAGPESPVPAKSDAKDVRLWPPFLRRGDTLPVRVTALRRGYNDSIELSVEDLPPGITVSQAKIPAGKNFALLLLSAAENAPGWAGSVRIVGIGRRGNDEVRSEAGAPMLVHAVEDKSKEPLQARLCDTFSFAVSSDELAPLAIAAAEDKAYQVGATGKVSIPLRIQRRGDFTEAFKLKPAPSSALESLGEIDVAAKATNATVDIDAARHKLPPGEHSLFLRGQTKGKYRRNPEAVTVAEQRLKEADKVVSVLSAEIKKSESALASLSSDAKVSAEKSLMELRAKLKEAEAQKSAADAIHKKAVEKAKPQEVTITVYSAPIRIRVVEEKKVASNDRN
jgi:hypothetical protein